MKRAPLVPDLLAPGLRLVFCGTAPSRKSAEARAYYAKPGNKFWPTLHAVGITPTRWAPANYPKLLDLGVGLTDLCKTAAGTDAEIPVDAFDRPAFVARMHQHQPQMIAFTSKNAARIFYEQSSVAGLDYGLQKQTLNGTALWVLPSPSGLATRYFDQTYWQSLADWWRSVK